MNKKILIAASAVVLVSAAVASLVVAGIITGPVGRDEHAVRLDTGKGNATAGSPYYYSCGVVTPRRPVDAQFDCIDPGHQIVDLFWTKWGNKRASATGRIGVASCLCEDPRYTWYPVRVTLTVPTLVRYGNASVFGFLTVRYSNDPPAGEHAEKTYQLTGPGN